MTRRDYEMLAATIKRERALLFGALHAHIRLDAQAHLARAIAEEIHSQNPRFDVARFLTDCGVTP